MGLRCGIVGLPNVGKSSLFNALTACAAPAENYPFCTIEPNVGVVGVPDPRLERLAALVEPQRVVQACVEFVDIAGLVAGASRGQGLGNRFLGHVREVQAIVHVVRCFADERVVHVSGRVDPIADIGTVQTELALADLESVSRALDRVSRQAKAGAPKESLARRGALERALALLDEGGGRMRGLPAEDRLALRDLNLLTLKPVLYVANVDEASLAGNEWSRAVEALAAAEGAACLVLCAALEAELVRMAPGERREFMRALGLKEPGLNRLIRAGYGLLGLQTFFTAGPKECRAWTVPRGATAPQAAGVVHSDFERGFIRAEVVAYEDFIACGGEQGAREKGKMRLEGKDYLMRDGDVVYFRCNV